VTEINPRPDGKWEEKDRGASRARNVSDTKGPLVQDAARRARNDWEKRGEKRQLMIRKQDGTIQSERTYGNDPEKSPG
jgi:hypothetical protein